MRRLIPSAAAALLLALTAVPPARAQISLRRDSLRVVYWPGQRGLAERTLRAAFAPLPLPGIPGDAVGVAGTIVLAPDRAAYDSITQGAAPDWSAGVAFPSERLIVLPAFVSSRAPGADPIDALRHERIHLALASYLPGDIPRWFDEGYATWAAGELDESAGWEIRFALLRGTAPPLDSLSLDWPAGAARARLAYLLSASAVRYLATRGGPRAFPTFLATWRRDGDFDPALREVYHLTPAMLENEWRTMVKSRYGWLLAVAQVGGFWLLLTFLFLALVVIRRRRDRRTLARMEAEEDTLPPPDAESPPLGDEPPPDAPDGVDEPWRRE